MRTLQLVWSPHNRRVVGSLPALALSCGICIFRFLPTIQKTCTLCGLQTVNCP